VRVKCQSEPIRRPAPASRAARYAPTAAKRSARRA
jgi:hypothetical protein